MANIYRTEKKKNIS